MASGRNSKKSGEDSRSLASLSVWAVDDEKSSDGNTCNVAPVGTTIADPGNDDTIFNGMGSPSGINNNIAHEIQRLEEDIGIGDDMETTHKRLKNLEAKGNGLAEFDERLEVREEEEEAEDNFDDLFLGDMYEKMNGSNSMHMNVMGSSSSFGPRSAKSLNSARKKKMGYMTHGSKRMGMSHRRKNWEKSDQNLFKDLEPNNAEGADLESNRWGVRKDSSYKNMHKVDKMKRDKQKAKVNARAKENAKAEAKARKKGSKNSGRGSIFRDMFKKKTRLKYEHLVKEDKDRELIASYCEEPSWKILFHFKGTVLCIIIEDLLFWVTLLIYAFIRMNYRWEQTNEGLEAKFQNLTTNVVTVGSFLTFFLVFYVNQTHTRYFQFHGESMVLMGRVSDVATMVRAILPMARARRINRYMNVAHVATYTGLSTTYDKDNFFDPLEARFALLTKEELHRVVQEIDVDQSGPKVAFELITWVMCDIQDAQTNGVINAFEAFQLRDLILRFRSTIAKIHVMSTLPIPFFYVHFLSLLTTIYLPLFAVGVAYETGVDGSGSYALELVSVLVVILQALFVIGLRCLGQQLSDPYKGEFIDLQVARYVELILNGSNQILAAKQLYPPSADTEVRLQLKMVALGEAFEYDTDDECVDQD